MIESDVLRRAPLLAELCDEAELEALASNADLFTYPRGYVLMSEGDFGSAMFVIVEGRVFVTSHHEPVAHVVAGDLVGEMALMTGDRRRATVTAETDVTVVRISKVAFEALLAHSPRLVERLDLLLQRRQAMLDEVATHERPSGWKRVLDAVLGKPGGGRGEGTS